MPAAKAVCADSHLPWQVCVVQAFTESGWGFRGLAGDGVNNRWGIKSGRVPDDGTYTKVTTEFDSDGKRREEATFSSWDSLESGIRGWVAFLSRSRYRIPAGQSFESDPVRFVTWIWGVGYATAPAYVERYLSVSWRLAELLGDVSVGGNSDVLLDVCIENIRNVPPGRRRRQLTEELGAHGFVGTFQMLLEYFEDRL